MTRTHWTAVVAIVLALLFAGAATVASAGDGDGGGDRHPTPNLADAGFARDMSVHHQQAVEMSFIIRDRTQDKDIRTLAYDIANTQANQRGMMLGWLNLWGLPALDPSAEPMAWMTAGDGNPHAGHATGETGEGAIMPGMATKAQLEKLNTLSGKAAEIEFLQLMIVHHNSGVAMAQGCVDQCAVTPQRDLAQGMVDAQRSEVELMIDLLRKRGAQVRT
ncbi:DUF305 domain-containing protein [Streptomyces sp. NPDC057638]|uniref:DUF305 domain-containing protein n=1 Tax=Streptomyces sp. NPDC057638 TaxID=3346190 RepID=UPI0036BC4C07